MARALEAVLTPRLRGCGALVRDVLDVRISAQNRVARVPAANAADHGVDLVATRSREACADEQRDAFERRRARLVGHALGERPHRD